MSLEDADDEYDEEESEEKVADEEKERCLCCLPLKGRAGHLRFLNDVMGDRALAL